MSERKAIEEKLRKKTAEIASLEEKIKAAKVYSSALRDVLRMLDSSEEPDSGETKLRAGSATAQARDVILSRGEPVHIDDLLHAMGKEVTRDSKASLGGSLAAYVRNHDIFVRTAPATFGLIELGHTEAEEEEEQPPAGFGEDDDPFAPDAFEADPDEDIPF